MTYTISQTKEFARWLKKLRDTKAKALIIKRITQIQEQGFFGDHKSVGNEVSELRVHFAKGYRVYYTAQNEQVILLLVGGVKDSQARDIQRAKDILKQIKKG